MGAFPYYLLQYAGGKTRKVFIALVAPLDELVLLPDSLALFMEFFEVPSLVVVYLEHLPTH